MRSLLFVPGDSRRKLEKALASAADMLIVDLEDSVSAKNKSAARDTTAAFLRDNRDVACRRVIVRVNELGGGLIDHDLAVAVSASAVGIMLPKCGGMVDVDQLSAKLRVLEAQNGVRDGATGILPIATETAVGVLAMSSYQPHPRLMGLTWGAEDLSAAICARSARDAAGNYTDIFRHARMMTILAASAAGVSAVDTVFPAFRDLDGLRAECIDADRDGFTGKMAIHPDQVAVVNDAFTPSHESVAAAQVVVDAFRAAGNPGVMNIAGKMYDRPHLRLAERIIARATTAGVT